MTNLLPLPVVKFAEQPKRLGEAGRMGELKMIPIAALRIDTDYQRDVGWNGLKNIRHIAENFAWRKFSPLVVSPRDGGLYAVIDGQHRAIAAKLRGNISALPCLVIHCGPAEEADAFATINTAITRVHAQALFKAKLAAGDSLARSAQKCAADAGIEILAYPLGPKQIKHNQTMACGAIEKCCQFYGARITTAALRALLRGANRQPGLIRAFVIRALCACFFENSGWVDRAYEAGEALAAVGIDKLMAQAAQTATIGDHKVAGARLAPLLAEVIGARLARVMETA